MNRQRRNTCIFVAVLLFSGVCNLVSRFLPEAPGALLTSTHYVTLIGLLLYWLASTRIRLIPSKVRTYMLSAAVLMLTYMLVMIFRYRCLTDVFWKRLAAYYFWIPQLMIPTLILLISIRIRRGEEKEGRWNEALLLIPAAVLSLLAMTNDIHKLVYVYHVGLDTFVVDTGTYSYGIVFYLMYAWMIGTIAIGLVLLSLKTRKISKKGILGMVLLWQGMNLLNYLVIDRMPPPGIRLFTVPQIHTFGMLGVIEVCIRLRLIPYNENYAGFFRKMRMSALITNRRFQPQYYSEEELNADLPSMQAALSAPVALSRDQVLYWQEIQAVYAFWSVDESAVHKAQDRLKEANEMIEQENSLIQAETEQKEKDAYLESRHRIYYEIASELYPWQQRIEQILESTEAGQKDFRGKIAYVSVLNAYVKRKTNLLLLAAEKEILTTSELFLALEESAAYLSLAGLETTAQKAEERSYPAQIILQMYDAFETIAEQYLGKVGSLMVSWNGDGLRLAAEADQLPKTEGIPLAIHMWEREDIVYIDISAKERGRSQ